MLRLDNFKRVVISSKNLQSITLRGNIQTLKLQDCPRLYRMEVFGLVTRLQFKECPSLSVVEYSSINRPFTISIDETSRQQIRVISISLGLQKVKWVTGFSIFCGKETIQPRVREWLRKPLMSIWKIA